MYRLTHITIGFTVGLFLGSSIIDSFIYALFTALGSYIPDIKHKPYVRGKYSHSFTTPLLLALLSISIYNILLDTGALTGRGYVYEVILWSILSICIGWMLHVFCDMVTAGGVYPLYPFSDRRVRLTRIKSNSIILNFSGIIFSFILLYIWLTIHDFGRVINDLVKFLLSLFL